MSADANPVSEQPNDVADNSSNIEDLKEEDPEIVARRVFAGNLSFRTNFKSLREAFSSVGTVEKVNVVSRNGKRLGFGFVQFSSVAEAEKAVAEMNGKEVDGREVKVELSRSTKVPIRRKKKKGKKPKAESSNNESNNNAEVSSKKKKLKKVRVPLSERVESDDVIYVKGISESTEKSAIEELFKDYGVTTVSVRSAFRGKGKPKSRFAFVTVDSAANQQAAVDALNEKELDGNTLSVKKAFTAVKPELVEVEDSEKPKKKRKPRKRKPRKNSSKDGDATTEENKDEAKVAETKDDKKDEKPMVEVPEPKSDE